MRVSRRNAFAFFVLAGVVSVTACSPDEAQPITFDSVAAQTTSTTSAPTTTLPNTTTSLMTGPVDVFGESWLDATGNLAGLTSECGNLSHISARPDGGLIAGVALQGLWSSTDAGATWSRLGQGEGSEQLTFRPTAIVYDPQDPQRFWVSGLYNNGVYVTNDGGATFRLLLSQWSAVDVSVDFTDPERKVVLAPLDALMLYRSTDGGATWGSASDQMPDEGGRLVAALAIDAQTYLVGLRDGPVPGIFRTTDGGGTWIRVHPDGVAGVPVRSSNGKLYWLLERGGGVLISADNGATWTFNTGRGISPFAEHLAELPDGRLVTVSDSTLIMSDDEGASWQPVGPPLPYEPTGLVYSDAAKAFFVSHFDCEWDSENPVRPGAIMRLAFEVAQPQAA